MPTLSRPIRAITPVLLSAVVLTACTNADTGTDTDTGATESSAASPASSSTHDHGDDHDHGAGEQAQLTEVASIVPRVVLAHDGGITVIDSETGETVSETDLDGFLRLNNSGDGRHVMVTAGDRFLAFDAAVQSRAHGDHAHNYAGDPSLTDIAYDEPEAGHVVVNEGLTALFSDGDGTARIVPTDQVAAGYRPAEGVVVDSGAPHHGVAVPFADGSVLITVGDEDNRQRIEYRDAEGRSRPTPTTAPASTARRWPLRVRSSSAARTGRSSSTEPTSGRSIRARSTSVPATSLAMPTPRSFSATTRWTRMPSWSGRRRSRSSTPGTPPCAPSTWVRPTGSVPWAAARPVRRSSSPMTGTSRSSTRSPGRSSVTFPPLRRGRRRTSGRNRARSLGSSGTTPTSRTRRTTSSSSWI
ncbi:hypothetical protein QP028_02800 [Corynebacterium suedekumii]|nr:hypothetical protein QP028_02800 [Corynebacterium suedekumii]